MGFVNNQAEVRRKSLSFPPSSQPWAGPRSRSTSKNCLSKPGGMRATQESPKPLTQSLTGKARARFVRFGPAGVLQRIVIWKRMGRPNIVPS